MGSQKVKDTPFSSPPDALRRGIQCNNFWIPAFAGMTVFGLFTVSSLLEILFFKRSCIMQTLLDTVLFNTTAYVSFILGIVAVIYAIIFVVVKRTIKKQ